MCCEIISTQVPGKPLKLDFYSYFSVFLLEALPFALHVTSKDAGKGTQPLPPSFHSLPQDWLCLLSCDLTHVIAASHSHRLQKNPWLKPAAFFFEGCVTLFRCWKRLGSEFLPSHAALSLRRAHLTYVQPSTLLRLSCGPVVSAPFVLAG